MSNPTPPAPAIVDIANAQMVSALSLAKDALLSSVRELEAVQSNLGVLTNSAADLDSKVSEMNFLMMNLAGLPGRVGFHGLSSAIGTLRLARGEVARQAADKA